MSMQTDTHVSIDRHLKRPSREMLDDEIKKYSRQFLTELFSAITSAKIELFRNMLATLVDVLDDYSTKMKKSKTKGLGRPSGHFVREAHKCLMQYVGSDSAKWIEVKVWGDGFLDFLKQWPDGEPLPFKDKQEFLHSISVLFRGKSGRHEDTELAKAYQLHEQGKSYGQIARQIRPDEYAKNPKRARNQIKSGVHRIRTKINRPR